MLTKSQQQAEWLAKFSDRVITLDPRHAGRIDWPTARYFYHQGRDAIEAAEDYVIKRVL
jgi:hypothetical protein